MSDKQDALRLADELDHGIGTIDRARHEAAAELRRLHKVEEAYNAWHEKTEWVQDTAQPCELGRHRADILKRRIDSLHSQIADLGKALSLGISRINELEAELHEQARLNGIGSEREARLLAVNAELVEALQDIAAADSFEAELDPQRAVRIARAALAKAEASK